ncbi:Alpha/Beta hydrolase protein [Phascolomyces articulosus]|uniref:Alpha/Beta hydrolase protein n=1 Tax=Phascolomyces articulosus TaxID=60185 RepID=A0AAD5K6Y8_9FUNG|nr:Alpha/Beta hydrolase protein [Phascolomyces articulosus]
MSNDTKTTHHYYTHEKSHFKELDLYIPSSATEKSPLLVFIHGGAWRSEDKADHAPLAQALVAHGFPVALINYRLSLYKDDEKDKHIQPQVQHPMHIQDSKEAIDYLIYQQHRMFPENESYPYDPSNVYLIGHSAGAHIAMMLTLDPAYYGGNKEEERKLVSGVIGAQGIYDLNLLFQKFPNYDFVPQAFGTDISRYVDASPVSKQPTITTDQLPEMLVVHSLDDTLVDIGQAETMMDHLKNNIHVPHVLLETTRVKGDHYDMLYSKEFIDSIVEFVNNK